MMGNNEGKVEDTLKQRGSVYGSYDKVCTVRTLIMGNIKSHYHNVNGKPMPKEYEVMFSDVILKLVRAAGKPEYSDSWHDLSGYATLIEEIMNGKDSKEA